MTLEPLGEVGANFSLQLSSRTQFTKINTKKVIAENQCEKHKKSSLGWLEFYDFLWTECCETDSKTHSIPRWFRIVSTSYTIDLLEICACFISK